MLILVFRDSTTHSGNLSKGHTRSWRPPGIYSESWWGTVRKKEYLPFSLFSFSSPFSSSSTHMCAHIQIMLPGKQWKQTKIASTILQGRKLHQAENSNSVSGTLFGWMRKWVHDGGWGKVNKQVRQKGLSKVEWAHPPFFLSLHCPPAQGQRKIWMDVFQHISAGST